MQIQQISIGRETAIKLGESNWWTTMPPKQVAILQLSIAELCMPFGEFQKAVQIALGRPVWTHEFAAPTAMLETLLK